jgi:hypothetical protein
MKALGRVGRTSAAMAATAALFIGAGGLAAWADNVQNDVTVGGTDTFTAGSNTTINYRITANNGDGQSGCNASDGSSAVVTLNVPSGVTATPSSRTFTTCGTNQSVVFTSSTPGTYPITASVTDSGTGTYNTNPATFTLKVLSPSDSTPPVITPNVTGTIGNNGWYVSDVTVSWTVTDPESSITGSSGCGTTIISTDTSSTTLTCTAASAGGSSSQSVTIKRDATAPTINSSVTPVRPGTGWWNEVSGPPSVDYTCSDAISGIDSCGPDKTFGEGENQSDTGTGVDNAGNSATSTVSDIDVDLTDPTADALLIGPAGDDGWFTGDVNVDWTVSDGLSGPVASSCSDTTVTADTANGSVSCTPIDVAGNTGTAVNKGYKKDATKPGIAADVSPARPASGWWNIASGAPTVTYTCDDATSGIKSCTGPYTFGEGEALTHTGTATDNAGNTDTETVDNIDVDLSAPAIDAVVTGTSSNGWYTSDVDVSWTVTDSLSGVDNASKSGCGDITVSADTDDTTYTCSASDNAGNSDSQSVTIKRDTAAPTITPIVAGTLGNHGWYTSDVDVSWTVTDSLSGVDNASKSGCGDITVSADTDGTTYTCSASDNAGNSDSQSVTIKRDATPPSVELGTLPDGGGPYYYGFLPPAPSCSASDPELPGSGLDGNCSVSGWNDSIGTNKTVTASAKDRAGNSSSDSANYEVREWTLTGFYRPVDMNGIYNVVKGGSTVPLKFNVYAGSTELTNTSAVKSFTQAKISCDNTSPTDVIEVTTTGGTSLRYDGTGAQFVQNWQTPKSAGSCYRVTMTTQDNSSLVALFKLK